MWAADLLIQFPNKSFTWKRSRVCLLLSWDCNRHCCQWYGLNTNHLQSYILLPPLHKDRSLKVLISEVFSYLIWFLDRLWQKITCATVLSYLWCSYSCCSTVVPLSPERSQAPTKNRILSAAFYAWNDIFQNGFFNVSWMYHWKRGYCITYMLRI